MMTTVPSRIVGHSMFVQKAVITEVEMPCERFNCVVIRFDFRVQYP